MSEITENENLEKTNVPLEKTKKVRSEKQVEQFKQIVNKRKENIEKKKLEKKIEASKLLLQHDVKISETKKKVITKEDSESENNSEPEIVIVSKKKKKKPIKIAIEESDEEDDEDEIKPKYINKVRDFKHQNYKKSIIKHFPPPEKTKNLNNTYSNKIFFD